MKDDIVPSIPREGLFALIARNYETNIHSFVLQTKHFHWSNRHSFLGKLSPLRMNMHEKTFTLHGCTQMAEDKSSPIEIRRTRGLIRPGTYFRFLRYEATRSTSCPWQVTSQHFVRLSPKQFAGSHWHLGVERYCESWVFCLRIQRKRSGQDSNSHTSRGGYLVYEDKLRDLRYTICLHTPVPTPPGLKSAAMTTEVPPLSQWDCHCS